LIEETGGSAGIRDAGLLESALAPAQNRHIYEDADLGACAATYAYHLTQAHAFVDGNKRIAAAVAEAFLESNRMQLMMTDNEIVRLYLDIAAGLLSRAEVERLLRTKIAKRGRRKSD
jgi:death-on-curing protein